MPLVPRPGRMPVRYLLPMLDKLVDHGFDKETLRRECCLDLDAANLAETVLDAAEASALLTTLARLTGRTDLAFEVGLSMTPTAHGLLGYALLSCRNYEHVCQLRMRYVHLITDLLAIRYQRQGRDGSAALTLTPLGSMPPVLLRFLIEIAAVGTHQQMQLMLNHPPIAYDLHLAMVPPPHHVRYAELAPARVKFVDGEVPGVTAYLPPELVDMPMPMSSPRVVAELEAQLQSRMRRVPSGTRWGDYVVSLLRESQGQMPSIDDLARRLGVSARTIDRHLAVEGVSFRDLARAVRIERARELLSQPGATVAHVAEQLGFGDAASFSRAFRRGAGMAPGEYQRWLRSAR